MQTDLDVRLLACKRRNQILQAHEVTDALDNASVYARDDVAGDPTTMLFLVAHGAEHVAQHVALVDHREERVPVLDAVQTRHAERIGTSEGDLHVEKARHSTPE